MPLFRLNAPFRPMSVGAWASSKLYAQAHWRDVCVVLESSWQARAVLMVLLALLPNLWRVLEPSLIALAAGARRCWHCAAFPTRQSVQFVGSRNSTTWLASRGKCTRKTRLEVEYAHPFRPHSDPNHTIHHLAHLLDPCSSLCLTEVSVAASAYSGTMPSTSSRLAVPRTIRTL
jgi:hypothetical protein